MIEVDLQGETVAGSGKTPGELSIHVAVYQHREDVDSVIHIHPHYAIIPGVVGKDLVPVCRHGSIFGAKVPLYPDSEKIVTYNQAHRMAEILGRGKAVVMKGHGAVVAEGYVQAAFLAAMHLKENARLLVEAAAMGEPVPLSEEEIERASSSTFRRSSISKSWSYYMERAKKRGSSGIDGEAFSSQEAGVVLCIMHKRRRSGAHVPPLVYGRRGLIVSLVGATSREGRSADCVGTHGWAGPAEI